MRKAFVGLFAALTLMMAPQQSEAKAFAFHLDATLGSSHNFRIGGPAGDGGNTFGGNIEVLPSLQFLMLSADLGLHYDFVQNNMTLRPGVRLLLGWFYLRAAVPLAFSLDGGTQSELFDMGVLFGAGVRVGFGNFSFVAEANASPLFLHIGDKGLSMPAELRIGLSYRF